MPQDTDLFDDCADWCRGRVGTAGALVGLYLLMAAVLLLGTWGSARLPQARVLVWAVLSPGIVLPIPVAMRLWRQCLANAGRFGGWLAAGIDLLILFMLFTAALLAAGHWGM